MSTKSIIRSLCHAGGFSIAVFIPLLVSSCLKEDRNAERKDKIEVCLTPDGEPLDVRLDHVFIGAKGGSCTFYVKSDVDFTPEWQDAENTPWASITRFEKSADGLYLIELDVKKRYSYAYYTIRSGMLLLSSPDNDLGTFVTVDQGMTARLSNNFSWLKYGSSDPRKMDGTPIAQWSNTLKDYGYTSTVPNGAEQARCFGKNGYLMLGDAEGHGADFITPYVESFRTDSLLMLTFRAVAFTSLDGIKDDNKLTVQILGGGVFSDNPQEEKTEMTIEVPYYDMADEEFSLSMWKGTDYMLFIESTDRHPLTSDTQIRFMAGNMGMNPKSTRIFLDNIYIRMTRNEEEFHQYFSENSGSGPDMILGVESNEENE